MQTDMMQFVERLVVAVESMSHEVKNISHDMKSMSNSIYNISVVMPHLFREKRHAMPHEAAAMAPFEQQSLVESVYSGQNSPDGASELPHTIALRNESRKDMNDSFGFDNCEESYSLTSTTKQVIEGIKAEAEDVEYSESVCAYSTNTESIIAVDVKDEHANLNEDWFSSLEDNDVSSFCRTEEGEGILSEMNRTSKNVDHLGVASMSVENPPRLDDQSGDVDPPIISEEVGRQRGGEEESSMMSTMHLKRSFCCESCGKCFSSNSSLKSHRRTHTGEKPYECVVCKKTFTEKSSVVDHMRLHSNERSFTCSVCRRAFNQSRVLKAHMRTHTGERPYKCRYCKKAFAQRGHLDTHMRYHTGERPCKCSQCGKAFTTQSDLIKHARFHATERPFKCGQCGKAFAQNSDLTRHMRCHSGERPFFCADCGKHFRESGSLSKHRRRQHALLPRVRPAYSSSALVPHSE